MFPVRLRARSALSANSIPFRTQCARSSYARVETRVAAHGGDSRLYHLTRPVTHRTGRRRRRLRIVRSDRLIKIIACIIR